jgi:hypothetical protein
VILISAGSNIRMSTKSPSCNIPSKSSTSTSP